MSVLINDMEMPERCLECPLYDNYNYYCTLYSFDIPVRHNRDGSTRPEWCEIEELPKCKDAVSRQAAIDALYNYWSGCSFDGDGYIIADKSEGILNELPSVESERKEGKWVGYKDDDPQWKMDDGSPIFLICSECHETVLNNGSAHWNFCPSCGSKMEGEEE